MHLSPNICTVLVCLQLWANYGKADMQLVKTAQNSRLRDRRISPMRSALSQRIESLQEAIRRDGRDLSVKSNIFPVTVDLTTILIDINERFQTLNQNQGQMKTQISDIEDNIEKLTREINERDTIIDGLQQSLENTKLAGMFTYVAEAATNAAAEATCVERGGHLASLDTDAKLDYVKEHVIPQDNSKVWLGAECVGCSVVDEDKWQWKSGSKLSLHHPLWVKNYKGVSGRNLPYDARGDDAMHLTMRCDGDCEFINHAPTKTFAFICEKSSEGK